MLQKCIEEINWLSRLLKDDIHHEISILNVILTVNFKPRYPLLYRDTVVYLINLNTSAFSRIGTEYGEKRVPIRENTDQNNFEYEHFLRGECNMN